jgi:hypothetical protein
MNSEYYYIFLLMGLGHTLPSYTLYVRDLENQQTR